MKYALFSLFLLCCGCASSVPPPVSLTPGPYDGDYTINLVATGASCRINTATAAFYVRGGEVTGAASAPGVPGQFYAGGSVKDGVLVDVKATHVLGAEVSFEGTLASGKWDDGEGCYGTYGQDRKTSGVPWFLTTLASFAWHIF